VAFLCALVVFVDGLDFGAGNVAAPAILRAFHAEKGQMGIVFSAGYSGILVGSFLFGYIGDRWGRRIGAIGGVFVYSFPALAQAFAGSLDEIVIWRFVAGLGIGGVIPNVIALVTDTAPKRYRASLVVYTITGYSLGTVVISHIAASFIPRFGWSAVFVVAGSAGLILSGALCLLLPESVRFLAARKPESPELRRLLSRLAPELAIGPDTRIRGPEESGNKQPFAIGQLFQGNQRIATPLLWIAYFFESLTYMTLLSWMPVILESTGLPPTSASLTYAYAAAAAIIAQLLLARPLDLFGPLSTAGAAILSVAALLYLGTPGLSGLLIVSSAVAGMAFCGATHNSLNCTVGIFYPAHIRSNGVGFASGMGRLAAVIGPVITGYLMEGKLPLQAMLYIIAGPYVVVMVAALPLGLLYRHRFRGATAGTASAAPTIVAGEPG
jgi:MFS transporter, AAHS family, 4-hydroxybenzoate transporter